jgi:hypothetical protein
MDLLNTGQNSFGLSITGNRGVFDNANNIKNNKDAITVSQGEITQLINQVIGLEATDVSLNTAVLENTNLITAVDGELEELTLDFNLYVSTNNTTTDTLAFDVSTNSMLIEENIQDISLNKHDISSNKQAFDGHVSTYNTKLTNVTNYLHALDDRERENSDNLEHLENAINDLNLTDDDGNGIGFALGLVALVGMVAGNSALIATTATSVGVVATESAAALAEGVSASASALQAGNRLTQMRSFFQSNSVLLGEIGTVEEMTPFLSNVEQIATTSVTESTSLMALV